MIKVFQKDILGATQLEPSQPMALKAPGVLEFPHDMLLSQRTQSTDSVVKEQSEDPLRTLITWNALSRPFKKRDRSFYTTVAVLVILFSPFALFLGGKPLFLALLAFGFVVFVLNLTPPENVDYKFSTQGVTIGDHFYHWQELDSFWISEKQGHKILNIFTRFKFPGVLMLVLDSTQEEEVKRICAKYLPFREIVPKSIIEKWAEGLQKHFPLENPQK